MLEKQLYSTESNATAGPDNAYLLRGCALVSSLFGGRLAFQPQHTEQDVSDL